MNLSLEEYERLNPRTCVRVAECELVFSTPTTFTRWRAESIFEKEPCTLEWLRSIEPGQTLLDVGANVGTYTVWAGVIQHATVIAIEPEAENFALLNRNIRLNGLSEMATALPIALSDADSLSSLHIQDTRIGGSNHSAGEALDFSLRPMSPAYRQSCFIWRLDTLVASKHVPVPDHIKIDVDGFEHRVIAGARDTLLDQRVKSLIIETNSALAEHRAMIEHLTSLGFHWDEAQVARAQRTDGPFKGVAEYVFRR